MYIKELPDPEAVGGKGKTFRQMVVSKIDVRDHDECWPSTCAVTGKGYGKFGFNKKFYLMPRATYHCFVVPIPPDLVVLHSCDNPVCCNPSHLSAGTISDNHQDMIRKGRAARKGATGERNSHARLTRQQVDDMRAMYAGGGWSYHKLAPVFGVAWQTIADVISGRHWK